MANLLAHQKIAKGQDKRLLMVEYQVASETAPYLVSSTRSVVWVEKPHPGDLVRAAVREVTEDVIFAELVEAVVEMGRERSWGNVQPLSTEGIRLAVEHVLYYELGPVDLLIPRNADGVQALIEPLGMGFQPSSWVPPQSVVVVPKDRTYLGFFSKVMPRMLCAIVHNASRGMAVAR